jgi:Flp pilus assembly pilin Flp
VLFAKRESIRGGQGGLMKKATPFSICRAAGWRFLHEQDGQDSMEYTLPLGFVALAAAAIFPFAMNNVKVLWNVASNHLSNAASRAKG